MKKVYLGLLLLMLGMGTASASFKVSVGQYSTLTFDENSDGTTVTLVKCECGKWSNYVFYWDEKTIIPDEVTVNGITKTVTQIGSSQNKPVFYDMVEVVFPSTTKTIKKYGFVTRESEGAPVYHGLNEVCFNFEKVEDLVTLETDFSLYYSTSDIPIIKNLTISNNVGLKEDFPFDKAVNLGYDESSTVYDLRGGCLMKKGDNETVVTILRLPEVTVPATVTRIAHHMPRYNGEEKTHITFEPGSQLTTINGSLNYCVFDEWPATVTTVDMPRASKGFSNSEFLSFVLPANHATFKTNPFSGVIYHHFEWCENPTLKPYLFSSCTFMEDLEVPDGITQTNGAFRFATFNGEFELPETLQSLVWNEFSACQFHNDFVLPDNVTMISSRCFADAHFYGNVQLPDNALVMGDSCFYNCQFERRLTMPDGVAELPLRAFYGCKFAKGLDLPSSLKTIPANVFQKAKFMGSLTLPDGLQKIESGAFAEVEFNNTTLEVPADVAVDKGAFVNCQIYKMIWNSDKFDALGSAPYLLDGSYFDDYGAIRQIYSVKNLDLGTSVPDQYSLSPFRVERLYTHCTTPPAVNGGLYYLVHEVADHYTATLYVPKGCKEVYEQTAPWCYFPKIVEFDETQQAPFVGDVNGDGRINVSDIATLVNEILTGPTEQNFLNDDVNEDSKVNVSDISSTINIILGIK